MITKLTNSQIGMLDVHLVAAELIRRGFLVSPTPGNACGADLLVTDSLCKKTWSVQVKTTSNKSTYYWNVGKYAKDISSETHVYIFVDFVEYQPIFVVVPSKTVKKRIRLQPDSPNGWPVFDRKHARIFAGEKGWEAFGVSERLTLPRKRSAKLP